MGSPTFGFPSSSNNAPPPMFGSHTNPTGGFGMSGGTFPNYPMFGPSTSFTGSTSPMANNPVFGAGTSDPMTGLSSGFDLGNNWSSFANMLGKAYGVGPGQAIYNILSEGLFNPQVASSFLNAMQPGINRGQANILQSFGSEGSRFGSAAALGLGDYQSQVNLNEQQTLASMYLQSQQEQLSLLEGVLPTLHAERANQGWLHKLIGGEEIAAGVLSMQPGTVNAGNQLAFNDMTGNSTGMFPPVGGGSGGFGFPFNTGTFGSNAPSTQAEYDSIWADMMSENAGATMGGASNVDMGAGSGLFIP